MSLIANGAGESGAEDFYNGVIAQSLRFGNNNSLENELDAPSDDQNFTISTWFKRSKLGAEEGLWAVDATGSYCRFEASGAIRIRQYNGIINAITTAFFRDTSAWYHLVVAWDMDNSTAADRIIIYVNGVRQTLATYHAPTTSETSNVNADGRTLHIGSSYSSGAAQYFEGYMADFNFVDGSVLAPTEFAETKNGVWIPIEPAGLTYGNNGFRLQFANSAVSSASSSTIGADTSGKARHFTSAGIVASDCALPDSPENNFSTLNTLDNVDLVLAEGNLKTTGAGNSFDTVRSTFAMSSGSWYVEFYVHAGTGNGNNNVGISTQSEPLSGITGSNFLGSSATSYGYAGNDNVYNSGNVINSTDVTYEAGDIIGVTFTGSVLKWYKNNSLIATVSSIPANDYCFTTNSYSTSMGVIANFGQDDTFAGAISSAGNTDGNGNGVFKYTPPSGFLALCTANLPEPTISPNSSTKATDHFDISLYNGNNSVLSISDLDFQPDWVWIKRRNANGHGQMWQDSSRGSSKYLNSASSNGEGNKDWFRSFDDDGFTVSHSTTDDETTSEWNVSGGTYVGWSWKANGATTTTNDASSTSVGTIDSVFQADTDAGFSIVTYTGFSGADGTATVAHGLGVAPEMIIHKARTRAGGWWTQVPKFLTNAGHFIELNGTGAQTDLNSYGTMNVPTSSIFTINGVDGVGGEAANYVAYCFASVEGYSKIGSYIGNANNDGAFIYTGFEPAFVIARSIDGSSFYMFDNKRTGFNGANYNMFVNGSGEEASSSFIDLLSNGFKFTGRGNSDPNKNEIHIYMAFAKSPFKYANAR